VLLCNTFKKFLDLGLSAKRYNYAELLIIDVDVCFFGKIAVTQMSI